MSDVAAYAATSLIILKYSQI